MKNYRFTLRIKITVIFIIVSTIMCITLALSAFRSADKIVDSIPMIPIGEVISEVQSDDIEEIAAIPIEKAKYIFRLDILYVMIGTVVLGSLAIFFLSGKALKPLEILNNTVKNQSLEDLSQEISLPHNRDEVYELTNSFNLRSKRIFDSYLMQKNFSANVAHELCTPLAVIQTKLDVFSLNQNRTIEDYNKLIGFIAENNQRLSVIVGNLLNLTNSRTVDLNQQVALNELVEETIYEFEDIMKKQNITAKLTGKNITVQGNDTLLKQAVYNLVSNAVKYNVDGGKIEVNLSEINKTVEISVFDTGIGIPDECKENLFEPFYRVDKSRSREIGGSGLGLALVKKIIETHGGKIEIKDNTPQGSCFIITLYK